MTDEIKKQLLMETCAYLGKEDPPEEIIRQLVKKRIGYIKSGKLFKFRECNENNFDALENQYVWMPPASSFYDFFDGIINIDLCKNAEVILSWMIPNIVELAYGASKWWTEQNGEEVRFTPNEVKNFVDACVDSEGMLIPEKTLSYIQENATENTAVDMAETMRQFEKMREAMPQFIEKMMPEFEEKINQIRTSMRDNMLVYCMTEEYDNHSLWENYADRYQGYCIEYDLANYEQQKLDTYRHLSSLLPVTYVEERPIFDILPLLKGSLHEQLTGDKTWMYNPQINADLNMQMFYKKSDYAFEQEWRFVIKNEGEHKLKFPFVSGIYMGKDISEENSNKLIEIASKIHVPVYKQKINSARNGFVYIPIEEMRQ